MFTLLRNFLSALIFCITLIFLLGCGIKGKPLPPLESPKQDAQNGDTQNPALATVTSTDKTTPKKLNKK